MDNSNSKTQKKSKPTKWKRLFPDTGTKITREPTPPIPKKIKLKPADKNGPKRFEIKLEHAINSTDEEEDQGASMRQLRDSSSDSASALPLASTSVAASFSDSYKSILLLLPEENRKHTPRNTDKRPLPVPSTTNNQKRSDDRKPPPPAPRPTDNQKPQQPENSSNDNTLMDAFGVAYSGLTSASNKSRVLQYKDLNALSEFNSIHGENPAHRCDVCNNLRCHDEFAYKYLESQLEENGMIQKDCYDKSEEDIIHNTCCRQIFYEDYWKIARQLYSTDNWTSIDFMFVPKCVHYFTGYKFPAPMDCLSISFVDKDAEK